MRQVPLTDRPDRGLFTHAEVMTLDKRLASGELGNAAAEMDKAGIPVRRCLVGDGELFPAGDYHRVDRDAEPRRQAFNYASAFRLVIEERHALNRRQPFLYLEDDAELTPDAFGVLPKAVAELESLGLPWDLFYLGGNFTCGPVYRVSENLIKPTYALDLHAVGVHPRCYKKLLAIKPSPHHTLDGTLGDMQLRGELAAYAVNPPVAYQRAGFSHNEGRFDDKRDRQLVRY